MGSKALTLVTTLIKEKLQMMDTVFESLKKEGYENLLISPKSLAPPYGDSVIPVNL